MRTGIVLSYDHNVGDGFIEDSNKQNIHFSTTDVKVTFNKSDIV